MEVVILQDLGGRAAEDKAHSVAALHTTREAFALQDHGSVVRAVALVPHRIDPGFRSQVSSAEDLFSL